MIIIIIKKKRTQSLEMNKMHVTREVMRLMSSLTKANAFYACDIQHGAVANKREGNGSKGEGKS